jgi:adenylate cyclase
MLWHGICNLLDSFAFIQGKNETLNMKKIAYTILGSIIVLLFFGFTQGVSTTDDQSRVNELIEVSRANRFTDLSKSLANIDEALTIARKIDYKAGIAACYLHKGQYLYNSSKIKESVTNLELAANIFKNIDNKTQYATCLKEMADCYRSSGQNEKAKSLIDNASQIANELDNKSLAADCNIASGVISMNTGLLTEATAHFLSALKTAELIKNDELIMNSSRELGNVNSLQSNYKKSNEYFESALAISQKIGNKLGEADIYCNIGSNYLSLGNQAEAEKNISLSLALCRQLNYKPTLALNLLNMGYGHSAEGQEQAANADFDQARAVFAEIGERHGEAEVLNAKGYLYSKSKNYVDAAANYIFASDIAKTIHANDLLKTSYDGLAYIFEQRHEYEAAYKYQKMSQELASQIFSAENAKTVTQLQLRYDFDKQQEQLRKEQDLTNKIAREKLRSEKYLRYFLIVLGLCAIGLAAFAMIAYRATRKAKHLLIERNLLITTEKEQAEKLLSDIIPHEIEAKVRQSGVQQHEELFATVMFVDFDNFSRTEQQLSPDELMDELDLIFKTLDDVSKKSRLETLKTLSDGYLCIGGLANNRDIRPEDVIQAAIKIQSFMEALKLKRIQEGKAYFGIKIGVHTGQIAGGIVGVRTIGADIWGETVQTASQLEKVAQSGEIQISESTYHLVKGKFDTLYNSNLKLMGKDMDVYQIVNFKSELSVLSVTDDVSDLLDRIHNS